MSYRDDDAAHATRASELIDEIAKLEREKLAQTETERRLEAAKRELATLQVSPPAPPVEKRPGMLAHVMVFGATASAAFLAYSLLV